VQIASGEIARDNRADSVIFGGCPIARIEAAFCFALFLIEAVAFETVLRENRADIAIELDLFGKRDVDCAQ
jgi:hypothetical protein